MKTSPNDPLPMSSRLPNRVSMAATMADAESDMLGTRRSPEKILPHSLLKYPNSRKREPTKCHPAIARKPRYRNRTRKRRKGRFDSKGRARSGNSQYQEKALDSSPWQVVGGDREEEGWDGREEGSGSKGKWTRVSREEPSSRRSRPEGERAVRLSPRIAALLFSLDKKIQ